MYRIRILPAAVLLAACLLGGAGCAGQSAPAGPPAPESVYRVKEGFVNLVKCPNLDCDVIEDIQAGQKVAVIPPQIGEWIEVRVLATGHQGYVPVKFLAR